MPENYESLKKKQHHAGGGWKHGLVVKGTYGSCRGPEFDSRNQHQVLTAAHNFSFRRINAFGIPMHRRTQRHTIKNNKNKACKIMLNEKKLDLKGHVL